MILSASKIDPTMLDKSLRMGSNNSIGYPSIVVRETYLYPTPLQ
jgi:hypothetical protein